MTLSGRYVSLAMKLEKFDKWAGIVANVGVLLGLVFLGFEIRANTASNRIALTTQFSTNFVQMNGDVATNRELAVVIQKAFANIELDEVESTQLRFFISQRLAQQAMMRRLYIEGFATREDVFRSYISLRRYAKYKAFRDYYQNELSERNQKMIFDENGVSWWLDAIDDGERVD